jgi:hypothetical protein
LTASAHFGREQIPGSGACPGASGWSLRYLDERCLLHREQMCSGVHWLMELGGAVK